METFVVLFQFFKGLRCFNRVCKTGNNPDISFHIAQAWNKTIQTWTIDALRSSLQLNTQNRTNIWNKSNIFDSDIKRNILGCGSCFRRFPHMLRKITKAALASPVVHDISMFRVPFDRVSIPLLARSFAISRNLCRILASPFASRCSIMFGVFGSPRSFPNRRTRGAIVQLPCRRNFGRAVTTFSHGARWLGGDRQAWRCSRLCDRRSRRSTPIR